MKNPKITVVTVCYNAVDTIEKTMLSVINQTYPNIEYIIIDGASTDGTVDIIQKYRDKIAYFVSEPDKGIYDAMNKGIKAATGDWINFMNAGDSFYNECVLEKVGLELSSVSSKVVCIYGDHVSIQRIRRLEVLCINPFYQRNDYIDNPSMGFHHQATFVRTDLAKEKMFDSTHFRLCADYNMIYGLFKDGWSFQRIPCFVAVVNNREGASSNNRVLQLKEHYDILGLSNNIRVKKKIQQLCFKEFAKKWLGYNKMIALLQFAIKK